MTTPPTAATPREVRPATTADAPTLARLMWDFSTEFGTPVDPVEVLIDRFSRILAVDGVFALLAGDADGFALFTLRPAIWFDGPVTQLEELYVVPHLRDQGIGSAMLTAARDISRAHGSPQMHINVDEDDVDTRRFYARHGFTNLQDADPEHPHDPAYLMFCYIGSTQTDRPQDG